MAKAAPHAIPVPKAHTLARTHKGIPHATEQAVTGSSSYESVALILVCNRS
jgi:hypothetical protein